MSSLNQSGLISRLRYELGRHGARATIGKVAQHARQRAFLDQTFVWYELLLAADRPRATLPPGLELVSGDEDDIPLLDGLPISANEWLARRWMGAGNDLWLVVEGGRRTRAAAFCCWIFRGSTPVRAVRGGWMELPAGVVCLEDSATSPSYRGRGTIAPGAWSGIADRLEGTGTKSIITKVEEGNKVMRWAMVKSGFGQIATMRYRRAGLRRDTALAGTGATAGWLAEQLRR